MHAFRSTVPDAVPLVNSARGYDKSWSRLRETKIGRGRLVNIPIGTSFTQRPVANLRVVLEMAQQQFGLGQLHLVGQLVPFEVAHR